MLDLVLTNKEGLVGNVKLKGLVCSDHEMVEFKILSAARRAQQAHCPGLQRSILWPPSGICSVEYPGINPWKEEGHKKAG